MVITHFAATLLHLTYPLLLVFLLVDKCRSAVSSSSSLSTSSSLFWHCPLGYQWEQEQCVRVLTKSKTPRCTAGQFNDGICLHVVRPLSRVCPPNYTAQQNTCVRVRTAAKELVCPPLYQLQQRDDHNHVCVQYHHLPLGYVCERGWKRKLPKVTDATQSGDPAQRREEVAVDTAADSGGGKACVLAVGVRSERQCPQGFNLEQGECGRVRYYPCDNKQPKKVDAMSALYEQLPTGETYDIEKSGQRKSRMLVGTNNDGSGQEQQICWDKQTVMSVNMCPLDAELIGDLCVVTRYFPLVPKCAGTVSNGKCVTTSIKKPTWKCPLNFPNFGSSRPNGLQIEQHRRLKREDPPWVAAEGGYCHRRKYADFALDCPNGFRAHLSTGTCRQRLTPVYVCTQGYEVTEHECVKTVFVSPISSSMEPVPATCLNKRCPPSIAVQIASQ
eukprot:GHVS01070824.1.p1 GENE.GHVS01070824.1~~GHVS01070824.1.p1  ORF type:complete len:443 (+),score=69.65 GHVS01070824.1:95-1423(+)